MTDLARWDLRGPVQLSELSVDPPWAYSRLRSPILGALHVAEGIIAARPPLGTPRRSRIKRLPLPRLIQLLLLARDVEHRAAVIGGCIGTRTEHCARCTKCRLHT